MKRSNGAAFQTKEIPVPATKRKEKGQRRRMGVQGEKKGTLSKNVQQHPLVKEKRLAKKSVHYKKQYNSQRIRREPPAKRLQLTKQDRKKGKR